MANEQTPRGPQQDTRSGIPQSLQPPELPRPRMPISQRAKIFKPFDPLKGYQAALREKEREAEEAHDERGGNVEMP